MRFFILCICIFSLLGCSKKELTGNMPLQTAENTKIWEPETLEPETGQEIIEAIPLEPSIVTKDWSDYFQQLNGAAVIYDPQKLQYTVYNEELIHKQRSPCSTFKIISSLIGLERGIIVPENSIRSWSGEIFWNENWNKDIGFQEAFQTSCVWYYRQVIDEIGPEIMQMELNRLQYGNCDISDWQGQLNTNNSNPSLTGFWIESSLKISPFQQVQVMERIFGPESNYDPQSVELLKQAMLAADNETEPLIYGKTGMGKLQGVTVDAWFTGFANTQDGTIYFCVYLGETQGVNTTSAMAKDIAYQIITDYTKTAEL